MVVMTLLDSSTQSPSFGVAVNLFSIKISLGSLVLVSLACKPAPNRPNFINGKDTADVRPGETDDEPLPDEGPVGGGIKGGKGADGYALLNCEEPETFRGLRGWRRLSNVEMRNTIVDSFGIKDLDYSEFPVDLSKKELFDTMQIPNNYVNTLRFKAYQNFAVEFSKKLDVAKFLPCGKEGSSCLSQKLPAFLELAWRRPSTDEDVKDLVALSDTLSKDGMNGDEALRIVIQAVVLSHHFLYRSELGKLEADGSFTLTDYELASALSYMIFRTAPDEALRKAAAAGELSKSDGMRTWATKMLGDARAKSAFKDFARMWLDSEKITRTTKPDMSYTPAVKAKMIDEIGDTFSHVMFDAKDSTYRALMAGNFTMAGPELDAFYNAKSSAGKTLYKEPDRLGILGQVGFLSSHAAADNPNPILRGVYVAEHTLCMHFEAPPPFTPLESKQGLSNKELFKQHNKPGCASCHTTIDNIGFAFENFDQVGKFRTVDAGQPIVVDSILPIDGKEIPVKSAQEMFQAISTSEQGMQCFVREAFRFGLGRTEYYNRPIVGKKVQPELSSQGKLDRCQIDYVASKMKAAKGDLKTGFIEMLSSPGFKSRLIGNVEESH